MERFLYRLSKSEHKDKFILKGAMMLRVWSVSINRPTKDIDFLGITSNDISNIMGLLKDVSRVPVEPDGLDFDIESFSGEVIKEGADYEGARVLFIGYLDTARINMQIDVGFNDLVSPKSEMVSLPSILDFPSPILNCYSRESTIAEKLETMVKLGELNSRMKDFYDIFILSKTFSFDGNTLAKAIKATFERRDTQIPDDIPLALSDEFANSVDKNNQWKAFINRNSLDDTGLDFPQLVKALREFLLEPLHAAAGEPFDCKWIDNKHWK
ncbi:nucleotidyl transferase AbiEii/AbiGii toxin family protein [bacterium AH-315-J21]|nr:nucleotidyl transferase AbiEii/AbiGii toxin family protein [bacterium AH-315-J21]